MMPLRIAVIAEDVHQRGGQERVLAELLTRLSLRHEVHLFGYRAEDLPPAVIFHRLRSPFPRTVRTRAVCIALLTRWRVRPRDYDVILSQGGNALIQNFALMHTCQAERRRLLREIYASGVSPARRLLQSLWYALIVRLERRAVRRCRGGRVLAVSQDLARLLCQHHGLQPEDITVCANGVDHTRFFPQADAPARSGIRGALGLPEDALLALFLGGLWREKGAAYSVAALAQADPRVHLCLAGGDDPAPFAALATSLGVADRLHFLPPTEHPEDCYHAADVFLFPGHHEGFGLVALEAAACGLPVLMTRVGVAEQLVRDDQSGYLIERDPVQIAQLLNRLVAEPELRQRLGQGAQEASLAFSWERQAEQIEAAFEKYGQR
jgi:UDP-glucose:(heptosyl)LPS alpha-1,3-glucosyltransferase